MVCFAGQVLQYNTLTRNARKVFAVMYVKFPDATMAADSTGEEGCPSCLGNIQGQTFKTKQKTLESNCWCTKKQTLQAKCLKKMEIFHFKPTLVS